MLGPKQPKPENPKPKPKPENPPPDVLAMGPKAQPKLENPPPQADVLSPNRKIGDKKGDVKPKPDPTKPEPHVPKVDACSGEGCSLTSGPPKADPIPEGPSGPDGQNPRLAKPIGIAVF